MKSTVEPKYFILTQAGDNGRLLDGVVFHNGQVVICWRTDLLMCVKCGHAEEEHHYGSGPDYPHDGLSDHGYKPAHSASLAIFPSFGYFKAAHLDSNPGSHSKLIWRDEPLSKEQAKDVYSEGVTVGIQMGKQLGP